MTILALKAAKHVGKRTDWKLPNLQYQKIIYVAHVLHLGAENEPLVWGKFEVSEFGPIHPILYKKLRIFGFGAVQKSHPWFDSVEDLGRNTESRWLDEVIKAFPPENGGRLVEILRQITHTWTRHKILSGSNPVISRSQMIEECEPLKRRVFLST